MAHDECVETGGGEVGPAGYDTEMGRESMNAEGDGQPGEAGGGQQHGSGGAGNSEEWLVIQLEHTVLSNWKSSATERFSLSLSLSLLGCTV